MAIPIWRETYLRIDGTAIELCDVGLQRHARARPE